MNSTQIEHFLMLAETLNYSEAAKKLYISQPVLSKRIVTIEKELGFPLFERNTHRVTLTGAGERMYRFFKETSDAYAEAISEAQRLYNAETGSRVLGIVDYLEDIGINTPQLLEEFHLCFPEIQLRIFQQPYHFWPEAIVSGGIDLAFTFEDLVRESLHLEFFPIVRCDMNLCFSNHHPLARREHLSLEDFRDEKLYLSEALNDRIPKREVANYVASFGLNPQNLTFIPTLNGVFANIISGNGITMSDDPIIKQQKLYNFRTFRLGSHVLGIAHRKGERDESLLYLRDRILSDARCAMQKNGVGPAT